MNIKPIVRAIIVASLLGMLGFMVFKDKVSGDVFIPIVIMALHFYFNKKEEGE